MEPNGAYRVHCPNPRLRPSIILMTSAVQKDSVDHDHPVNYDDRPPAHWTPLPMSWQMRFLLAIAITLACLLLPLRTNTGIKPPTEQLWYRHIVSLTGLCEDELFQGAAKQRMHAGYIGLQGDTTAAPKRSFFWLFEAEKAPQEAPLVLITAGGPGTSALVHAVFGQSACRLEPWSALSFNRWRWNEKLNLLFLDHPVNTGYSLGPMANNSHSAALDVYDFLQKFYDLFPAYAKNKLVLSSGSYGGVFMPHIASVIHERNKLPRSRHQRKIFLDSIMLTNPLLNVRSHFRWLLHYRCIENQIYDTETCERLHDLLPQCLEKIDLAFLHPTLEHKIDAIDFCQANIASADTNGILLEDIRKKCNARPTPTNPGICQPRFMTMDKFFNSTSTKEIFAIPQHLEYRSLAVPVNQAFYHTGDMMAEHHLLLEPLLAEGIRLLVYAGAQDANCAWPGVLSSLELLQTPFQEIFINAEDKPWSPWNPRNPDTTIRSVGIGAGNLTYILINDAGHFVIEDYPRIAKLIAEHWVFNQPFFN